MFWNRRMETLSRNELAELQIKRLRETFQNAQNVPFYKKRFAEIGICLKDLHSLDDIQKLPFTIKQDLREGYPFGFFAVPLRDVVRIHTTSGTTGKPTVVGYTKNDLSTGRNSSQGT